MSQDGFERMKAAVEEVHTWPPPQRWLGNVYTAVRLKLGEYPVEVFASVGQLLESSVKNLYPPNGIPLDIVEKLQSVAAELDDVQHAIARLIEAVGTERGWRK